MISLHESSVLIVGLARNCEKQLTESTAKLIEAFSSAKIVKFLIVESDSADGTADILQRMALENKNFNYASLGHLQEQYPKRTDRIALCRNYYLKLIEDCAEYPDVDYVVIADLDGVNGKLSADSVASCWSRTDWDVCAANQDGPYYDIWALRHPLWSPNDCWKQAEFLMSQGVSRFKSIYSAVYSRMIKIPPHADWIEVKSAFGGLAVYRKTVLKNVSYAGLSPNGEEFCEHVSLHQQIREKGGRIYINPKMINAGVVEHARNASGLGLMRFWFRCQLRDFADYLRIAPHLKQVRTAFKDFLG